MGEACYHMPIFFGQLFSLYLVKMFKSLEDFNEVRMGGINS